MILTVLLIALSIADTEGGTVRTICNAASTAGTLTHAP